MVSLTIPQAACHIQASLYGIIDYTTACLSYPSIVIWYHRLYHSLLVISMHCYMVSLTVPQPACHIQASLYAIIDCTTACLSYSCILIWYHRLYHSLLVISMHCYMVSLTIPQPACHIQALLYGIIDYTTACLSYRSIVIWYHRLYNSLLVISKHHYMVSSTGIILYSLLVICHVQASLYGIIDYTTACLSYPSIVIWYHRLYHSLLVISKHRIIIWYHMDYTTACLSYPSIIIWYHLYACHIHIIDYTTACLSYPSICFISKHPYMVSSTIPQPACHIQASCHIQALLYGIISKTIPIPQPACHIQASLYGIVDYTTACLSYPCIIIWYH